MARLIAILGLLLFSAQAWAVRTYTEMTLLGGLEYTYKTIPNDHFVLRWSYGGRFTWGMKGLALEAEALLSQDRETFSSGSYTAIADDTIRAKLGARGRYNLSRDLSFYWRGGVELERNIHTEWTPAQNAVYPPLVYQPYAGIGVGIFVFKWLTLDIDVTSTFINAPTDFMNSDYQFNVGLTYKFP